MMFWSLLMKGILNVSSMTEKCRKDYGRLFDYIMMYMMAVLLYETEYELLNDYYIYWSMCYYIDVVGFLLLVRSIFRMYFERLMNRLGNDIKIIDEEKIKELIQKLTTQTKETEMDKTKTETNLETKLVNKEPNSLCIYILIWKFTKENVGHAALLLYDSCKRVVVAYVSHWPAQPLPAGDPAKKDEVPSRNHSLLMDIKSEGKNPDIMLTISEDLLSLEGIENFKIWNGNRLDESKNENYKFKFVNCADVVKEALREFGFALVNPIARILMLGLTSPQNVCTKILITILLKKSNNLIQKLYCVYTFLVVVTIFHIVRSFLYLICARITLIIYLTVLAYACYRLSQHYTHLFSDKIRKTFIPVYKIYRIYIRMIMFFCNKSMHLMALYCVLSFLVVWYFTGIISAARIYTYIQIFIYLHYQESDF